MHTPTSPIEFMGKKYDAAKLLRAVSAATIIDFPPGYYDHSTTVEGEHHAFTMHDGVMYRLVIGKYENSRKARLISKIVLKKAIYESPPPPQSTTRPVYAPAAVYPGSDWRGDLRQQFYGNRR